VGGWISDKVGGSIVTQVISAVMVVASAAVGYVMLQAYGSATPEQYFLPFMALFIVLFAASGIGNGSTFRTIGVIFDRQQAGPVLGWTSAVAAYGAFVQPVAVDPGAGAGLRGVDAVVGGRREPAGGGLPLHDQPAVLARRAAGAVRRHAAHLLLVHGADLRRPALDRAGSPPACCCRRSASAWRCRTRHALRRSWCWRCCAAWAAATSPARWRNISFFFPKERKGSALGLNAGLGNLGVSVVQFVVPLVVTAGVFGALGGEPQTGVNGQTADGCRTPASSGCRSSSPARWRPGSA
jgi:hypothetical protein